MNTESQDGRHGMSDFNEFMQELRAEAEVEGPEAVAELDALTEHYRLARQIIELRRERGLTQGQVAGLSGIHQSEISRIEHGRANPTLDTLSSVGRALGMVVSYCPPETPRTRTHAAGK